MPLYRWLIWNLRANAALCEIDRQLDDLLLRSVTLTNESRSRLSSLMVQMVLKLMPDYDFRQGFYVQFFVFSREKDTQQMILLADRLREIQIAAVEGADIEIELMAGLLKAFTLLFALKTNSAYANRLRGEIYALRSRDMNDLIQHFLATKLNEAVGDWPTSKVFYPESA